MRKLLPLLIILAVLGIALGAGWYLTRPKTTAPATPAVANRAVVPSASPTASPVVVSQLGAQPPHSIGPDDAPVTLEEFGDFQCPPCGLLHPVLKTMEKEFGSQLRVIFRQFPLAQTHPHAVSAARAAEAAGMQGKFWEMHDMIFENQRTWHPTFDARPTFEGYAVKLGLDVAKYRRDLMSSAVDQRIALDGRRASALGVNGTPTVFLNGREVPFESLPPEKLRPLIQAELKAAGR
ncbi:MAG TPA: thioredoxin domain-containing protein [Pyrinomonadaceae bacterium]|nr:thioredoxin domain-containing protein [Pyrinomonadaceae bacterium]